LQPIESCSKGLENGDHRGRGFNTTFNENIFGFELGAFRVARRMPCDQSLLEARNRPSVSLPCKPVEVLRSYVWAEALKPLNARDQASNDMSDCFDFTQKPLAPPA
jgi:hypothetical protein